MIAGPREFDAVGYDDTLLDSNFMLLKPTADDVAVRNVAFATGEAAFDGPFGR